MYRNQVPTPLHEAIRQGQVEAAKRLIDEGADKEALYYGENCLYYAVEEGQEELVKHLVESGSNIDTFPSGRSTPLLWAIEKSQVKIAVYLIDKGANLEAIWFQKTPLLWAIEKGQLELVSYLLDKGVDIEAPHCYLGALAMAIGSDQEEVAKYLIDRGANIEATRPHNPGITPLYAAIEFNRERTIRYLLEKGANIEANWEGRTPLHHAIKRGCIGIAQCLIDKGANLETVYEGLTPLHLGIMIGILTQKWELAISLIRKGADVNVVCEGVTPFMRIMALECPLTADIQDVIKMMIVANTDTHGELSPAFREMLKRYPKGMEVCKILFQESQGLSCAIDALTLLSLRLSAPPSLSAEGSSSSHQSVSDVFLPFKLSQKIALHALGPYYQDTLREKYAANLTKLFYKKAALHAAKKEPEQPTTSVKLPS